MSDPMIRASEPSDADALTELYNLPGVRAGTLRLPFTPRGFAEDRLKPAPGVHSLVAALDGTVVGHGTLMRFVGRQSHVGEVFLSVHDGFTRRGIGLGLMEALLDLAGGWLGLRRVELSVMTDNLPAIRLYERLGFELEGTRRASVLRAGVLVDCHMMARLLDAPVMAPGRASDLSG